MSEFKAKLTVLCNEQWKKIKAGNFYRLMLTEQDPELLRRLYVTLMVQVFHYTKYNAMNQACATFATPHTELGLVRFALRHAIEETGHENMVVHDLRSIGVDLSTLKASPLPATAALSGYLDSVALRLGVLPRLGYSFWAEDSYEHLQPLLAAFRNKLGLQDNQLTFFVSHATIDEKHANEVKKVIDAYVKSEEEEAAVSQVALTTLFLLGQLLENVAEQVQQ